MSDQPATPPAQPPFAQRFAHFLTRTTTQYGRAPLSLLTDRGLENRLLTNLIESLPDGAIIAGGFVLGVVLDERSATDIDVFFTSEKAWRATVDLILNSSQAKEEDAENWSIRGYSLKEGTKLDIDKLGDTRFLTFTHPKRPALQLMRMVWYESAEHVIDTFDFTCVQLGVDKQGLVFNPVSFLDISRKRLCLSRMQFPASTLRRMIKYVKDKGWYCCPGSLVRICEAIQAYKGEPDVNDVVYVD